MLKNENNGVFGIKIISTNNLVLHESFDHVRVDMIKKKILRNKVFTNPILCVKQSPNSGNYVVLDGANRTTALRQLGLNFALVQEFKYEDLQLDSWCHVLLGKTVSFWVKKFLPISKFEEDKNIARCNIKSKSAKVYLLSGNKIFSTKLTGNLEERLKKINQMSEVYLKEGCFKRINYRHFIKNNKVKSGEHVIIYPYFSKTDILSITMKGLFIPSGISRHIVKNRALHVNLPISILKHVGSLNDKNNFLNKFLNKIISIRQYHAYDGSVCLFDE